MSSVSSKRIIDKRRASRASRASRITRLMVMKKAYAEYRSNFHFFNPDTADTHQTLFHDSFAMYEKYKGITEPVMSDEEFDSVTDEENQERVDAFRDQVETWEALVMNMNILAEDFDTGLTIRQAFAAFEKVYQAYHKCVWSRLSYS